MSVRCILSVALCLGCGTRDGDIPAVLESPTLSAREFAPADDAGAFALDLYRRLSAEERKRENLLLSPLSVQRVLAMCRVGARGQTEGEIAKTLHGGRLEPPGNPGIQILLADRLWVPEYLGLVPTFTDIAREQFGAEPGGLDVDRPEEARQEVNRWVAERTGGRISEILPQGAISSETRLLLTGAVYFRGLWAAPFPEEGTRDEDFHLPSGDVIQVPMMHRGGEARYGAIDDLQVLELRYGECSLSMVVLLPADAEGLDRLEDELSPRTLQRWSASVRRLDSVEVHLPRFTLRSRLDLGRALQFLGMPSAFDPARADFSGITGSRDLYLSSVVHSSFAVVNEEGTEAAAATAVAMDPTGQPGSDANERPVFRADHPFLFVIQDKGTGDVAFVGRVVRPTE